VKLTSEDLQKLHTKQVANIIRKLSAGKTITRREEETLARERSGESEVQASAQTANLASTWDELAQKLSEQSGVTITRRAIQDWRNDPRYEAQWPRPRGDRHNVQEWIVFMQKFGLKRADEAVGSDEIPEDRMSVRDWKGRREELMCEKLEREILRDDGKLLVATEIEIALGQLIAGVSVSLDHFAPGAARFVVGLRDIHDVQAKLQSEIDAVKQHINAARYMDDCVDEVAQSFPFDPETEEIYKRVSFSGQDRAAFVELVRCATTKALQAIGKRALAATNPSDAESNPETPTAPAAKENPRNDEPPIASPEPATAPEKGSAPSKEKRTTQPPNEPRPLTRTRKRDRATAPAEK
jgi:hypothetical protein